ncbi:MAG TPA: hypothetical protein PL110_18095 [Candidatus Eremiobacteraeota bacterium]|nr:MAG: hypothetical protein BWY64_03114 [bacterium ADurb.Bin363]HPZ10008.1 hypothetical protein [Candidatus Eremiobacteraeota bacterium]
MEVPSGNPLIENVELTYNDIEIMHRNLQEGSFTGYIKLSGSNGDGFIFMLHGGMIYALEYVNEVYQATPEWRLKNRAKNELLKTSTYILSPSLVSILSQIFAYDSISLTKKKLTTVLKELEQDGYCGIIQVIKSDISYYILLDQGKPITDSILENYGNIICGNRSLDALINEESKGKVKLKFLGQRQGEIDLKKKQVERDLSKIKNLIVIVEKGIFIGDALKVDNILMDDWYQLEEPGKKINDIIIENDKGNLIACKVQAKKNIGANKIYVPGRLLKKLETNENESLIVIPKAT